jgi:D-alanine--poly(phosphoribitol) ligase subunit 2
MIKGIVVDYLEEALLFQFDADVTEATDLFKAGIMDSYGYLQLMQFIQGTFEIELSRAELLSNVTTSLSGIVALVEAKLAGRQLARA